jgi:CAAX prenyl protease-like protein
MEPARRGGHDWWAYLGPYGLFLVLVEIANRTPDSWAGAMLVAKVGLPAALLAYYLARGALPELRGYRPGVGGLLLDVAFGVGVAALWMGPFLLMPDLPRPAAADGFDPDQLGAGARDFVLTVRLVGFAAVTPFVEELFVRSFLMRLSDVVHSDMNFARVPLARFTWRSFVVTVLWFTFTHVPWEWGVAFLTGVLFNLWLYHRRHLMACVVAHAAANAAIWVAVVTAPIDLWIFL